VEEKIAGFVGFCSVMTPLAPTLAETSGYCSARTSRRTPDCVLSQMSSARRVPNSSGSGVLMIRRSKLRSKRHRRALETSAAFTTGEKLRSGRSGSTSCVNF
jgi:hypothetical protein